LFRYDDKYPEGIPTSVQITLSSGKVLDSKLVMFPSGHARNSSANLNDILTHKFKLLAKLSLDEKDASRYFYQISLLIMTIECLTNLATLATCPMLNCKRSTLAK
jgi:2-methylcitrate dehydratase